MQNCECKVLGLTARCQTNNSVREVSPLILNLVVKGVPCALKDHFGEASQTITIYPYREIAVDQVNVKVLRG